MLPTMVGPQGKGKGGEAVPEDIKLKAQRQAERTSRLLDARQRTIGVDKDALDRQVREHQQQKQAERDFEQTDAERLRQACAQADEEEYRRMLDETQQKANLWHHWQVQKRSPKREWDLNDPKSLKKDAPPRTSDYVPPECTVSSMQVFDAENKRVETPRRNRKELIEENDRLMQEREQERQRHEDTKRHEDEILLDNARRAEEEEMQHQAERVKQEVEVRETQKQMDRYRKNHDRRWREEEDKMAQQHINTMRDSALVVEDRTIGYRFDNPNRPRPDHFKGFSQEEIHEIHNTQGRQMEEKDMLREEERKCQEAIDKLTLDTIQKGDEMEQTLRDTECRHKTDYYEQLRRQAKYDRRMKKKKNKEEREYQEVFSNSILSRFGTSLV